MPDSTLAELVDVSHLTACLDANIPQLGNGPVAVEMVHGGFSNVILSLDHGNGTMMLRRPPVMPPPGSECTALRGAGAERTRRDRRAAPALLRHLRRSRFDRRGVLRDGARRRLV